MCSILLGASLITACKKENVKPTEQNKQASGIITSGMPVGNRPATNKPKPLRPSKDANIKSSKREFFKNNRGGLRALIAVGRRQLARTQVSLNEKKKLLDNAVRERGIASRNFFRTKSVFEAQLKQAEVENNKIQQEKIHQNYKQLLQEKTMVDNAYEDVENTYNEIKGKYNAEVKELNENEEILADIEANEPLVGRPIR